MDLVVLLKEFSQTGRDELYLCDKFDGHAKVYTGKSNTETVGLADKRYDFVGQTETVEHLLNRYDLSYKFEGSIIK